jgi:hypothetical protein
MKAKKFRKFDEGGPTDEMDMEAPPTPAPKAAAAPKNASFGEAFDNARRLGLGTFSFNGKQYTTQMAAPKAAVSAPILVSKPSVSAPAAVSSDSNEIPQPGNYRQETYQTPLKAAISKYGPEVMDNLGKIAAGLGAGAGAYYGGSKLIDAARAADKARQEAALVAGNAGLRSRMGDIVANAAKKVAEGPALREANEDLATRMAVAKSTARGAADRAKRSQQGITVDKDEMGFYKSGGKVKAKKYAKGGMVSSASKRADGCAQRGKTRGKTY